MDNTDSTVTIRPAIPVIRIFDLEKARQYYLDYLGFSVDWEHRQEEDIPSTLRWRCIRNWGSGATATSNLRLMRCHGGCRFR